MNGVEDNSRRRPAVAGRFYPDDAADLHRLVEACLTKGVAGWRPEGQAPRAVISPHAGYRFSGWLAGAAWRATARAKPTRVVVLSPSHQHAFDGVALPSGAAYGMPGFDLPIDREACAALVKAGLAHVEDAAHDCEHGVETQLPFLHRLHPNVPVIPLVIGRSSPQDVAQVIDFISERLGGALLVLSSDLSHFLPLGAAKTHDLETARLIETGRFADLTAQHACGVRAVAGFMASRLGRGLRVQRLAMDSSATVSGDDTRTVGYGAWAFFDTDQEIILPAHRENLLKAARKALTVRLRRGRPPQVNEESFAMALRGYGASFVTLQKEGRLRGCIGSLAAHRPLVQDVVENTMKSALNDPRFRPVAADELAALRIKIAILSPARPMRFNAPDDLLQQLKPGCDGLILREGGKRGTFLPMVWENLKTPENFIEGLKVKAGLPRGYWSDTLRIDRFYAESFAEAETA